MDTVMTDEDPQANDPSPGIDTNPSNSPTDLLDSPPVEEHASPSKRFASPSPFPLISSEDTVVDNNTAAPKLVKRPRVTKVDNSTWWEDLALYSPMAGTAKRGSTLLKEFGNSGWATDAAARRLAVYADYEFETCTFFQEIIPNLFLGSVLSLRADTLKKAGITRVLTVMASNPHLEHENSEGWMAAGISREFIMMQDLSTFQSHPWYQTTSAIIDSALHANERILIHCRKGISRSVTVAAAYLVFRHGLTPDQALYWIRLQRPIAMPNSGFREQLSDFYTVLQIDHPGEFGWCGLSMCEGLLQVDGEREARKRVRREMVEGIWGKWNREGVEWVSCRLVGINADCETFLQRLFGGMA